jgi:hypothetical protein
MDVIVLSHLDQLEARVPTEEFPIVLNVIFER